jgi:hypothetical protein
MAMVVVEVVAVVMLLSGGGRREVRFILGWSLAAQRGRGGD